MSLSEQLKQVTSPYHRQLDQLPLLKSLLSPSLDARQYQRTILGFYHCFSHWQPLLDEAMQRLSAPSFAHINNQLPALNKEVQSFKYQLSSVAPLPRPDINSIEVYLGYSYVLTGAQLGASFIIKRLQKSSLAQNYSFDYYQQLSQGAMDFTSWKANLDLYVSQKGFESQKVIDAAVECFTQLTHWFEYVSEQELKVSKDSVA